MSLKYLIAILVFAVRCHLLHSYLLKATASAVDFGIIGLASSQTLRLSIIAFPPTPIYPPSPVCVAQIGFANSSNVGVGPSKLVSLGPGQGDFLDLNGGTLAVPPGGRTEVRPVVTLLPSPAEGASACLASAEIL